TAEKNSLKLFSFSNPCSVQLSKCGCSELSQKGWHSPTNLWQGDHRAAMLPGAVHAFDQRTSQHQLIMQTRHHLCPAFGLLWSPKPRLLPKQHLLVEQEAMLVGVAQARGGREFT